MSTPRLRDADGLDYMYTTANTDIQTNILRQYLEHESPDPYSRCRAIWSIEGHHDGKLAQFRLRHFHRWPRSAVPADDLYRDANPRSGAIYFPGREGTHDAKCTWAGMVTEECAGNDLRPAFDRTWPRDNDIPSLDEVGTAVIEKILLACAPEELSVCIYINRDMIDSSIAVTALGQEAGLDNIKTFLSSPLIRGDAPVNVKFASFEEADQSSKEAATARLATFKHWLRDEANSGGTLRQETVVTKLPPGRYDELNVLGGMRGLMTKSANDDLVLLARRDNIPKSANTRMILDEMVESLGLQDDLIRITPASSRNIDVHGYAYMERDHVGGNIHYPDECGRTSVSFVWRFTDRLTEEHLQTRRFKLAFKSDFVRAAQSKKVASNGGIDYILWPRSSSEDNGYFDPCDTTSIDSDNAYIIWIPGQYDDIEEEVFNLCVHGEKDAPRTQGFFSMSGTHEGNLFWDRVLEYFQRSIVNGNGAAAMLREYQTVPNKHSLKLFQLLSIARTFIQEEHLLLDHEYPFEEIQEFFDAFAKQWRKVWRQTDEILGIGLIGSNCENPNIESPRASREGLYTMLKFYQDRIEERMADMDMEISFFPFSSHS